jgi:hypothetical protein
MNSATPPEEDEGAGDGLTMRHVWVASAVGAVVLVLVLAAAIAVISGGDGEPDKRAAAAPPSTTEVTPPTSPSASHSATSSTAPASSAPPAGPVVQWRGTLTVNGPSAQRDLDAVPPRTSDSGGDVRGDWLRTMLKGMSDAQLAVVQGRPGATECRDAATTAGDSETEPLDEGDAVCVLTSGGHVARLIATHTTQTSTSPELTFTAVVWTLPGGGS